MKLSHELRCRLVLRRIGHQLLVCYELSVEFAEEGADLLQWAPQLPPRTGSVLINRHSPRRHSRTWTPLSNKQQTNQWEFVMFANKGAGCDQFEGARSRCQQAAVGGSLLSWRPGCRLHWPAAQMSLVLDSGVCLSARRFASLLMPIWRLDSGKEWVRTILFGNLGFDTAHASNIILPNVVALNKLIKFAYIGLVICSSKTIGWICGNSEKEGERDRAR